MQFDAKSVIVYGFYAEVFGFDGNKFFTFESSFYFRFFFEKFGAFLFVARHAQSFGRIYKTMKFRIRAETISRSLLCRRIVGDHQFIAGFYIACFI